MENKIPDNLVCYEVTIGTGKKLYFSHYVKGTADSLLGKLTLWRLYWTGEQAGEQPWMVGDAFYKDRSSNVALTAKLDIDAITKGYHKPVQIKTTTFVELPANVKAMFREFETHHRLNYDDVNWYTDNLKK